MLFAVGGIGLLSSCNMSTTPDKMTLTAARNAFKKGLNFIVKSQKR